MDAQGGRFFLKVFLFVIICYLTDRHTERQKDIWTERHLDRKTEGQRDKKQKTRKTERQKGQTHYHQNT